MADDRGGHQADRPCSGDEHVFPQNRKRQRGVDGVAEGIEDGGNVLIDPSMMTPDVGHGQRDVLGKCSGAIHTHALAVRAEMTTAGQAVPAAPADHVPFPAHDVARKEIRDI